MKYFDRPNRSDGLWPPPPRVWRLLWIAVALGIATLASMCFPFRFQAGTGDTWLALQQREWLFVLGNIVLFVPIGFAEGGLVRAVFGVRSWCLALVVLDAGLLSVIGETFQLWLPARHSGIGDVAANTLGGALGAWIAQTRLRLW